MTVDRWILISALAVSGAGCGDGRGSISAADAACAEPIRNASAGADAALGAFERLAASRSSEGARTAAARRALDAARTARDSLEKIAPTPRLETSRREELVYLNHLVPGFEAYLNRTIPETEALERLRSILRRGRTHRERGRAAMPAP